MVKIVEKLPSKCCFFCVCFFFFFFLIFTMFTVVLVQINECVENCIMIVNWTVAMHCDRQKIMSLFVLHQWANVII